MSKLIKFRLVLWSFLVLAVSWLLYMSIAPTGKIEYVKDFNKDNYFIRKFSPQDRINEMQKGTQAIIGEPVYFSLRTQRQFDQADFEIKIKNDFEFPIIEIGVLSDKTVWRHKMYPLNNEIINNLAKEWNVTTDQDLILLQKEKKFENIKDFLKNLPVSDEIAVYNYDLNQEYRLDDYQAENTKNTFNIGLRGAYQYYTYIKNEDLDIDFIFENLNQIQDKDDIIIFLYYQGQVIDTKHFGPGENVGMKNIKISGLPEGVYKLEVKTNSDTITKQIKTNLSKMSFINKVWIWETIDKKNLYTNSNRIFAQTQNPNSLQTLAINQENLKINETYRQFSLKPDATSTYEINFSKPDIIIAGDRTFAFAKNSFIDPDPIKVDQDFSIEKNAVNFIITKYQIPKTEDGWIFAKAGIDLTGAYREKSQYGFILAIPGLRADDGVEDEIIINKIKIDLEGKSLWRKIQENL